MKSLKELDLLRDEVEKCIGCGLCLQSCPVYAEEQNEDYVARGRNHLLKKVFNNHKDLVDGVKDRFSKCLLCRRCTMVCPQGVRTDLLTMAARVELAKGDGLSFTKAIVFRKLLKDRKKMKAAIKTASKLQWLLPVTKEPDKKVHHIPLEKKGKIRHIPMFFAGLGGGRQLPSIAKKSLSEQISEIHLPVTGVKTRNIRVGYFSGCATEFCFPEIGKSLISVLTRLGIEIVFPKDQGCCGISVFNSGDLETAREMALHNIRVFSQAKVDFVVTGCATCGSALKEGWASCLTRGKEEKAQFKDFGSRVRDISEFLVELACFKPLRYRSILPENLRITYHDPCHLARYQGVIDQPRKILKQVFGDNFIEMENQGCCGMGGTFNLSHYDLSQKIAKNKIASIAETEADIVINNCPGCMIQLIDNIERYHLPQRVVHLIEAIEPIPEK
ncbi:MAG: (Fe-S)-binding protein [Proteobacteria bacterium]|nr:(Fe-S)-binding protein [Pseudomonadota bacterium]MBU1697077.1 (Fe-S)-binding protein [Pseudomonadota bacterium]